MASKPNRPAAFQQQGRETGREPSSKKARKQPDDRGLQALGVCYDAGRAIGWMATGGLVLLNPPLGWSRRERWQRWRRLFRWRREPAAGESDRFA